jgi:MFS family permease
MAIFSLFSVLSGFSTSYGMLFAARIGVGFGEASLAPAAFSMISDHFPVSRLGRAMSLFTIGNLTGSAAALIIGGMLISRFDTLYAVDPAALHGLHPWQLTLACIALPGLLLFPCFLLMREPTRKGAVRETQGDFGAALREFGTRRNVLLLLVGGSAMVSIQTQAVSMWLPALMIRVHGLTAERIGLWLGVLLLGGGIVGSLTGGWLTDWTTRRGRPDGPIAVAALSFCIVTLFSIIAPLMPTATLAFVCFVPVFVLMPITFSTVPAALQMITPNRLRARVSAFYLTVINLVGLAIGPVVVGFMTDHLFGTPTGVRYSIALISAFTGPPMVVFMLLALKPYRRLRESIA